MSFDTLSSFCLLPGCQSLTGCSWRYLTHFLSPYLSSRGCGKTVRGRTEGWWHLQHRRVLSFTAQAFLPQNSEIWNIPPLEPESQLSPQIENSTSDCAYWIAVKIQMCWNYCIGTYRLCVQGVKCKTTTRLALGSISEISHWVYANISNS